MENSQDKVLTVSQVTGLIKNLLEGSFPSIVLKGEISNFRPNPTGHLYFVLKDSDSQINAVMFRGNASYLNFTPKDGMTVQAKGRITVYPQRGNYQIQITSMTKAGIGDIMEIIEERKRRLAQEGLFAQERKKSLPLFPKTVGVVTSPTGAALRDILNITKRRNPKVSVIVFPAIVQGDSAAPTVENMIKIANKYNMCDVLIVGRGGGSLEDLLPFSDEKVVRAVAESHIPVISAVGHDIDWALSDFAADVRAPTPSAAAELAVPVLTEVKEGLNSYKQEFYQAVEKRISSLRLMLKTFTPENMELQLRTIQQPYLARWENARQALIDSIQSFLEDKKIRMEKAVQTLENCNPQNVFARGYSMVTDSATGKIVRCPEDAAKGSVLKITPAKGEIFATVN
ncbi:MAG: exodeoxyribonuclease VII large subunit [Treponema sp.]|nr:exodeoxyribonuclease VII large subunit [Spirochaetales bacterium]MDY4902252.1 exodeoxyribonuclease VII large subunit [Treponema sp.]